MEALAGGGGWGVEAARQLLEASPFSWDSYLLRTTKQAAHWPNEGCRELGALNMWLLEVSGCDALGLISVASIETAARASQFGGHSPHPQILADQGEGLQNRRSPLVGLPGPVFWLGK